MRRLDPRTLCFALVLATSGCHDPIKTKPTPLDAGADAALDGDAAVDDGDLDVPAAEDVGPAPPGWLVLAAGGRHSCALSAAGEVVCWGSDAFGELQAAAGPFASISSSFGYACGLAADGTPTCWGMPVQGTAPATPLAQLSAGAAYNEATGAATPRPCAVSRNGTLRCWGATEDALEAWLAGREGAVERVAAGGQRVCALAADGTIACWSAFDDSADYATLHAPPEGVYAAVSVGFQAACALTTEGNARCWGSPDGALGEPPPDPLEQISVGRRVACGLRGDGSIACWGANAEVVDQVPAGASFVALSVGGFSGKAAHACALTGDDEIVCWGSNGYGQAVAPGADPCRDVRTPIGAPLRDPFSDAPIAGVQVCAAYGVCEPVCATTDATGGFELTIAQVDPIHLRIQPEGYPTVSIHAPWQPLAAAFSPASHGWHLLPETIFEAAATSADVAQDPALGRVYFRTERAGCRVSVEAGGGDAVVVVLDDQLAPVGASDVTVGGDGVLLNVPPGDVRLAASCDDKPCEADLALVTGQAGVFEVSAVADELTFVSFSCD